MTAMLLLGLAGESATIPASFTATENLTNVAVRVVPELAPYVQTNSTLFMSISKGQTVNLNLTISAPADALPKVLEGVVQLRRGVGAPQTFAQPLPVIVTVFTGDPFSTDPDPGKVVEDNGEFYPIHQVIISLKPGLGIDSAKTIATEVGGIIIGFAPSDNSYLLEVPAETIQQLNSLIAFLEADLRIDAVDKNVGGIEHGAVNDLLNLQSQSQDLVAAYNQIKIQEAYKLIDDLNPTLSSVKIGIIDSGIDKAHPEFIGVNFGTSPPGAFVDPHFHGTAIAGVIGANNLSARMNLPQNSPQMNGIAAGLPSSTNSSGSRIDYIIESRRTISFLSFHSLFKVKAVIDDLSSHGVHVINISLGFITGANSLKRTIEQHAHIIFVAAAGNSSIDAVNNVPGGAVLLPNIITVAANNLNDQRLLTSNFGDRITISAPGENVYAPITNDNYGFISQTSAAAPMVTGVAALLKALKHQLSPTEIKAILQETGDPLITDQPLGGNA